MIGYKRTVERQDPDRTFMNPIPVRINGSVTCEANVTKKDTVKLAEPYETYLDDDVDFTDFVRKRTKRFYVGGFKSSITQDKLIRFVESKGLVVTWVKIWNSKRNGRVTIRLNVEASENYFKITEPGFWPRGVKCRPWLSNNKYNNSLRSSRSSRAYVTHDSDLSQHAHYDDNDNYY